MISDSKMLETLGKLISFPSVSVSGNENAPYGEAVDSALEYVLGVCSELGFNTKNCNHKIGYAEIGDGDELIGILAHLDVVPAGNDWDMDPFTLSEKDGKLYGRGISDDKGPAVAAIYAMKDILDEVKLNKRIRIIFGLSEEVGDWDDMEYYKETEELPAFGFTPDADFPAIYGEKGIAHFKIVLPNDGSIISITGGEATNVVPDRCKTTIRDCSEQELTLETVGIAAHGSTPECGTNAISKLMEIISKNENIKSTAADFYNSCFGFDIFGEKLGCAYEDIQSGKLTCNVGTVNLTENGIEFTLDIRYPVTCSLEWIEEKINERILPYSASAEIISQMNPVYADKNGPVIGALIDAYSSQTGDTESEPTVIGGGTYARAMDNIIAFGPMIPGRELTEHMKNEYLLKEDFLLLRKIYRKALENLLKL